MAKKKEKHLAVALQGGGAHGAFTWGVLDRLLEEEELKLDGFVGTSAGAMNAAVLAYGLMESREKARTLLEKFWRTTSEVASMSYLKPSLYDKMFGKGNMDHSPGFLMGEIMSIFVSPYQSMLPEVNPLRKILLDIIDFDALHRCKVTKLYVCATNVRRGRVRVFDLPEMSVDSVLASANLPFLFKAVTIDGEDYWDGGYMGNPPLYPLIDGTDCSDIMLVQINPINVPETPKTSMEIRDRINELSFNSSLMLEMRRFDLIDRMMDAGFNPEGKFRKIFIHNINPEVDIHQLNTSSKLNANWDFLTSMKNIGRRYASEWLNQHYDAIGVRTTTDIHGTFL